MLTSTEAVFEERGWFHRESTRLRARRLPKGDRERNALARMGRGILGRWRAMMKGASAAATGGGR